MQTTDPFDFRFDKTRPFSVPEAYFEQLPQQTEQLAAARGADRANIFMRAIAASFVVLLVSGVMLLWLRSQSDTSVTQSETMTLNAVVELLHIDAADFTTEADVSIALIEWEQLFDTQLHSDVDAHEIIEYLFEQEELDF